MLRALVYIVPIGLAVFALFDLRRSEVGERAGLHQAAWAAVIVLLPVVGPIVWLLVSRQTRASAPPGPSTRVPGGTGGRPGSTTGRGRPAAPDDDPDFLWRLEQERRRRARGSGTPRAGDGVDPGSPPTERPDATAPSDDEPTR